jgi:hypothetical protein
MTPVEIYVEYTYTFNVSEEELRAAVHYGRDGLRNVGYPAMQHDRAMQHPDDTPSSE